MGDDLCGKYLGDNDATCPQLTCIRRKDHGGLCDNVNSFEDDEDEDGRPRPFIVGLLKARNELVREGNIYRCLQNMIEFCDTLVVCDDASTDGTDLIIEEFFAKHNIPKSQFLRIPPAEQDFRKELAVKQRMLERIHKLRPSWIWWQDADEIVPDPAYLRNYIYAADEGGDRFGAFRFPYVQLWRDGYWARVDDGFADGKFVKLWRWRRDLRFDVVDRTHHMQFPLNVGTIVDSGINVIHLGNWGKNLQWKCIQYWGGLGGVERHMDFENASYELLNRDWSYFPAHARVVKPQRDKRDYIIGPTEIRAGESLVDDFAKPKPFTPAEKNVIKEMKNLKALPEWFTVVIPTHNRAEYLAETIGSLKRQRYQRWIALVLDDGSTDRTPELMHRIALHDPRIFYARHPKRGAVAMNEIGMRFACEATEWWTRLGSDDTFEPDKLLHDALAFKAGAGWCYGPYRVMRQVDPHAPITLDRGMSLRPDSWQVSEMCNRPQHAALIREQLLGGRFHISWANIAATTSLLRVIHRVYGNFCPPELVNMEDFVVNARMARFDSPVFRGRLDKQLVVCTNEEQDLHAISNQNEFDFDAVWRVNPVGASASTETTARDEQLSREIIAKESTPQETL